jgi:hypothetical protein
MDGYTARLSPKTFFLALNRAVLIWMGQLNKFVELNDLIVRRIKAIYTHFFSSTRKAEFNASLGVNSKLVSCYTLLFFVIFINN